jgi:hypothetical protein
LILLGRRADRPSAALEMIGLPGSGKSTVAQELVRRGLFADGSAELVSINGIRDCLGRSPMTTSRFLISSLGCGPHERNIALWRLRQTVALRRAPRAVFDEGSLHRRWLVRFNVGAVRTAPRRPPGWPVVHVVVEPHLARERLVGRAARTSLGPVASALTEAPVESPVWQRAVEDYRSMSSAVGAHVVHGSGSVESVVESILLRVGRWERC